MVQLYWLRVLLGIVAGAVTASLAVFLGNPAVSLYDLTTLLNSITVALLIYFITYYIFRAVYKDKIAQQSKILSTAIGMYFFSWIAFFVLTYTAIIVLLDIPVF
jgi:hypothetical protein